jgi:hypothetical protein
MKDRPRRAGKSDIYGKGAHLLRTGLKAPCSGTAKAGNFISFKLSLLSFMGVDLHSGVLESSEKWVT